MPLDDALKIARQIADALEAAHERGITHRDLKPANIKIKPDGTVKVLDFGLAKLAPTTSSSDERSPTFTIGMTEAGMMLGTASYMAPEQARGKAIDKRADIFAFGVVLHELITGQRLFGGEDAGEMLAKVIRDEPDLSDAPPSVQRLLSECLQKDPRKRLRDIGDVWRLLDGASAGARAASAPRRTSSPQMDQWLWPARSGAASAQHGRARRSCIFAKSRRSSRPCGLKWRCRRKSSLTTFAISPDGRKLVFNVRGANGRKALWLRHDGFARSARIAGDRRREPGPGVVARQPIHGVHGRQQPQEDRYFRRNAADLGFLHQPGYRHLLGAGRRNSVR